MDRIHFPRTLCGLNFHLKTANGSICIYSHKYAFKKALKKLRKHKYFVDIFLYRPLRSNYVDVDVECL